MASASDGFTKEERDAMKERARELKLEAKRLATRESGTADIASKIDEMAKSDQPMARRIVELVQAAAPDLMPRTWYGMPAWANADGKIVCFYQDGGKFQTRYATLGFQDAAQLDDEMGIWATSFAIDRLTSDVEKRISSLVRQAAGL